MENQQGKKIDREFVLSDSSVNVYGYRLMTEGYLMDEYSKNPIGYYMHGKAAEYPREMGVLVKWTDLRLDGDKVMGKPEINMSHPRAQQTIDEIEGGFLNAASMGNMVVVESREDLIDGEMVFTATKWFNRECSLVDIPGNFAALTDLQDFKGQQVQLSDLFYKQQQQQNAMKKITLTITPALAGLLGLADNGTNADENGIAAAIQTLYDTAQKVPVLELQKSQLATEKGKAIQDLADYKEESTNKEVKDLIATALTDKRITKDLADTLETSFKGNPDALKKVLAGYKPFKSITEGLQGGGGDGRLKELNDMSFSDLDKKGLIPELMALDKDAYKAKFKQRFGNEPNL